MIIKKIHTMAQLIVAAAGMREIAWGRGTGCSRKTAAFVKKIIDKYTKRPYHPFDPASLVFLEQRANGSGLAGADGAMVMVTCRLLFYLIQNAGQAGLFSDRHSFLVQQLTAQVEQNLEILQDSAAAAGRELGRCYLEYQKVIILDGNARMERISGLQERMHRFERIQTQYDPLEAAKVRTRQLPEPEENRMPFVMTHAFFANLNHWVRENRMADHRQMWKLANVRQMVQQKLKYHMQRFLQEEDFIKQEEQLSDMIWQYGKDAVLEYLEQADIKVYEKLLPVLHTLSGRSGGSGSQEHRSADQSGSSRLEHGNIENSGREYRNAENSGRKYRDTENSGREYRSTDGRYPAAVTERILEKYQAAAVQLEYLLAEADEETKALLQETAAEYKKYFLEYVRIVSGIQRVSAAKELAGRQESSEIQRVFAAKELAGR